ncbi:MAG: 50S ribosomal protein L5 [Candidatus Dojkabacteria bacterium]
MADKKIEVKPLKQKYLEEVRPSLQKELGIENVMAIPKLEKIVLNIGAGKAKEDKAFMDELQETLGVIAAQKPVLKSAKAAISNFKIREGMPVGMSVTLRGERMWAFLDKFINIALPRSKDFRGVSSKSFDGRGNYTLGINDQTIFPEVDTSKNIRLHGLQISIITSAQSDDHGRALLKALGMPFKK